MVANRSAAGHSAPPYRMISAARGQTDPAQPACSGALLLPWPDSTADHASMISMALAAYRSSRVAYQASASVYAAIASSRSSVHPWFGRECDPHSTVARGFGVRSSDAYRLDIISSKAGVPTRARTASSRSASTSTPGWTNAPSEAAGPNAVISNGVPYTSHRSGGSRSRLPSRRNTRCAVSTRLVS
ncbi:hypothetical protein JCM9533A_35210 [Catenuloplanes niger JCM 9533]